MATPLHSLFSIWQEINTAVQTSIEQRSVFLHPITARQFDVNPITASIGNSRQVRLSCYLIMFCYFFELSSFCS